MLIKFGADVNERSKYKITALKSASDGGHIEICELLIKNGANVDNKYKEKVLVKASEEGDLRKCKNLIKLGVYNKSKT